MENTLFTIDNLPILLGITFILSYLLGSIPYGLVLCKLAGYGDIRTIGSGNIGATNVLRTGNKLLALITLICDMGKGAFAVFLCQVLFAPLTITMENTGTDTAIGGLTAQDYRNIILSVAGLSAILGHNFPIWLRFKGGKGVATTFGTVLMLSPPLALALGLTWLVVAIFTRYSSLSAIVAFILSPLWAYFLSGNSIAIAMIALGILGLYQHRENIQRLLSGTESKIGQKNTSKHKF